MEERRYSSWLLERQTIGEAFRLRIGVSTIGRHSSSVIRITDSHYVSRNHAEIVVSDDDQTVEIRDLNSVNGIFVNEILHRGDVAVIKPGDAIGIGVIVDKDASSVELTNPVYILKHAPLRVLQANSCQLKNRTGLAKPIAAINPTAHAFSKPLNENVQVGSKSLPTLPQSPKVNVCITISDDEEDEQVIETRKEPTIPENYPNSKQQCVAKIDQNINTSAPIKESNDSNPNKPVISTHIPIISTIKQERVRAASADIQSIFGETDDDILAKIKDINPYVYKNLNDHCVPVEKRKESNSLIPGDYITLSSDDDCEELEEKVSRSGKCTRLPDISTQKEKEDMPVRSPNIFETSLNDSNGEGTSNLQRVKEILNHDMDTAKTKPDVVATEDDYTYEPKSEDEDVEELMFSQIVINDMKEELADEDVEDFVADLEDVVDQIDFNNESNISEVGEKIVTDISIKHEIDAPHWNLNDEVNDEEFDEELETKVSDWSAKLFSQSNMSQIYEVLEIEETKNNENKNENDKDTELQSEECYDLGFSLRDENDDEFINELYISLKEKCETKASEEVQPIPSTETSPIIRKHAHTTKRLLSSSDDEEINSNRKEESSSCFKSNSKSERLSLLEDLKEENVIESDIPNLDKDTKIERKKPVVINHDCSNVNNIDVKKSVAPEKPNIELSVNTKDTNESNLKKKYLSSEEGKKRSTLSNSASKNDPESITSKEKADIEKLKYSRVPPSIIEPPQLPKHKGKLRGVSACPPSSKEKLANICESIRHENHVKDLKRKWIEKPSVAKKREKESTKVLKESRKERLKELADKQQQSNEKHKKRKRLPNKEHGTDHIKKPKIKITEVNRGAFLTIDPEIRPQKTFKIPKLPRTEGTTNDITKSIPIVPINTDSNVVSEQKSMEGSNLDLFGQALSKPDELIRKGPTIADALIPAPRTNADSVNQLHTTNIPSEASALGPVCKESSAARAKRTTNKITFASMQRNFVESHLNQKKLETISHTRTCLADTVLRGKDVNRKKKKVRFNDTPLIHYIERISGATKKVDKKDVMPLSTINDRRAIIRGNCPIVDCTNKIVSMILHWSNDWLEKRNAEVQEATDVVMPMPNQFNSFDTYKSVLFPLMKLEFLCRLEREYKQCSIKPFKVSLQYLTNVEDRYMLITKYFLLNKSCDTPRCDLAILNFSDKHKGIFAYVSANRRGAGSCSTVVFEILSKNFTKEYLSCIKEINVRPVVDNIRVEFGAFNSVYQLESTPLFKKILNPLELLKSKPVVKRKIRYKGFDKLNEKQEQILLNTYAKIIDETIPNITLIKGPPGTGKSCVITNLALQTLYGDEVRCMDRKILICAQSNGAVDVIAAKLYNIQQRMRPEIMFRLIRYGIPDKIDALVAPITLQKIVEKDRLKKLATHNNIQGENKENLKNEIFLLEAQILELQNKNIQGTVQEDELLEKQKKLKLMRNILNQSMRSEDERRIHTWYLTNANIVCTTLSSCVKLSQYVNYFDICIIDEATQCTEPWTLLPLKFGINSLVLVGDTQQLPATVLSKKAMDLGLGNSMFTRIQRCLENIHTNTGSPLPSIICGLQTQYRMHPEICKWPNLYFYKNELINGACTYNIKSPIVPFSILNLSYDQNEQCSNGQISNNLEAEFVVNLIKALDGYIPNKYNSYGIITPYAQHRTKLEESIKSMGLTNIMVNTIDSYQGLEKDVIVISNARTHGIGFLANYQRLNVALTRPKKCLILCGNFKHLETVPSWRSLLNNARERKLFHDISAPNALDIHRNVIEKLKIKHCTKPNL